MMATNGRKPSKRSLAATQETPFSLSEIVSRNEDIDNNSLRHPKSPATIGETYHNEAALGDVIQVTYFGAEVIENFHYAQDTGKLDTDPGMQKQEILLAQSGESRKNEDDEFATDVRKGNSFASPRSAQGTQTAFSTYTNISALAMIGCLIRIGLETVMSPSYLGVESPDAVLFKSFMSNVVGSVILGILVGSTLKELGGMLPIYTGISTGLCGSITTYAKFNQQVSEMLIGEASPDGNQFFTAFLSLVLGILAPLASFVFGRDVSMLARKMVGRPQNDQSTTAKVIDVVMGILFVASWITLIAIAIVYRDRYSVIFNCISLVFAPFGALLRFFLAKLNKIDYKSTVMKMLPMGTLAANLIGSLVLAATHVMVAWISFSCPGKAVMGAIGTGFCACLTTVSTMMSEIKALRDKSEIGYSHLYPFVTIVVCLGLSTFINGVSYAVYIDQFPSFNQTKC